MMLTRSGATSTADGLLRISANATYTDQAYNHTHYVAQVYM